MQSEANVKAIVKTDDESKWCRLSARADAKVLGKMLGKIKSMFKAVQNLFTTAN